MKRSSPAAFDPAWIPELEKAAFAGWPAEEVRQIGAWHLRATHGVTRRANSVWAGASTPPRDRDARIAAVEEFYRERGLPPQFQIGPVALDEGLDGELQKRGYDRRVETEVHALRLDEVVAPVDSASLAAVKVHEEVDADWFELSGQRGRFRGDAVEVYERLVARLVGTSCFVTAYDGPVPVAVGLGARHGRWVGISSMRTLESHRRRGFADAVVRGILAWAGQNGASHAFLQVEPENQGAIALYGRLGFVRGYGYHYRRLSG